MRGPTPRCRVMAGLLAAVWAALLPSATAEADVVRLKSGQSFSGIVDRDGTLVQVYDDENLRRVLTRDSKIESIVEGNPARGERFQLVQPLTVHAGEMPIVVHQVEAEPWDEFGRRKFRFVGSKSGKPTTMTQAIIEMTPKSVKVRGVDGFWSGSLDIKTVPREVILGLLAKVDRTNQAERLRVGRFLIQAEWFEEARAELDRIAADFPDMAETVATVKGLVRESDSRVRWASVQRMREAGQPRGALARLKTFPLEGAPADVLAAVRDSLRELEGRRADDRALAEGLLAVADAMDSESRRAIEAHLLEMLRGLSEAPDAVRDRLEPFRQVDPALPAARRFALAQSGWVADAEGATSEPGAAEGLWQARDLVRAYLVATDESTREQALEALGARPLPASDGGESRPLELPQLGRIVRAMAPPLHDERLAVPGRVRTVRVRDDPNPENPTEYAVQLPPEYHPLRSYPALVVLHGGEAPSESLAWLAEEAKARGYILLAPEYNLRGERRVYRYGEGQHAAVELALRDARRRFAIDSDRVFLVGQLEGANMAWDVGLAHPDLFAGVGVISGLPGKYVWPYKANAPLVPLYIVAGDLAPAEDELSFERWIKPLVIRNQDILYVRYFRRGLEPFPEQAAEFFDWADSRRREPAPKAFEAVSARECDSRFFGLVLRSFAPGRSITPEAAAPLGENIKPARLELKANAVLNKVVVTTNGVNALDVWIGPSLVDFDQRVEVQLNGRLVYKGDPKLSDLKPYLEDLRIRGDREQPYWLKVTVGPGSGRN